MTKLENKNIELLADKFITPFRKTKHSLITSAHTIYSPELNPYTAIWNLVTRDISKPSDEIFLLETIKLAYPKKYKELNFWNHPYSHGLTNPQMALTTRLAELHQDIITTTVKPTINHCRLEFAIFLDAFIFDLINYNSYDTTHETVFKITNSTLKAIRRRINNYITTTLHSEPADFYRLSATVFDVPYEERLSELWEGDKREYTPIICPHDKQHLAMQYIMPVFTDAVRSFSKNFTLAINTQEQDQNTSELQRKIDNYIAEHELKHNIKQQQR